MKRKFKKLEKSFETIALEADVLGEHVASSKHIYETGMSASDRESVVNRYAKIVQCASLIQFAAATAILELRQ